MVGAMLLGASEASQQLRVTGGILEGLSPETGSLYLH